MVWVYSCWKGEVSMGGGVVGGGVVWFWVGSVKLRGMHDGMTNSMGTLHRLSEARTRSLSAENFDGAKGGGARATAGTGANAARDLGVGWKVSPSVKIAAGQTFELGNIEGPGALQHFWMTPTGNWRTTILRIYWDGQEQPSVECPIGDFFCMGWGKYAALSSLAVCVNPGSAFNCFWTMPFRKRCRITVENLGEAEMVLYYQVTYALGEVGAGGEDVAYFHARFRRSNPVLPAGGPHVILEKVSGRGQYVGTYLAWGVNNNGWWGEGEIKFYMDGDGAHPTICGTGTEDYFLGSYNFENQATKQYQEYCTPYAGLHQVIRPDGVYQSQQRFGMYRWHITDPIRFEGDLRVDIQALGWRSGGRYLPLMDDVASVAYWYQTLPSPVLPQLQGRDGLEVI